MKQIILLAAFICASLVSFSQKVKKDANGNYYAVKATKDSIGGKKTTITFTDTDGTVYPIYEGSRGGHYIIRINKETGKIKKQYLKLD